MIVGGISFIVTFVILFGLKDIHNKPKVDFKETVDADKIGQEETLA